MAGRTFTRQSNGVGNRIKAEHVNELQAALEDDDARIDAKPGLTDVQGVVQTELSNNATVVAAAEDAAAAAVDAEVTTRDLATNPDVTLALSGTTGVAITDIRPGRIDARVRGLSTAASHASNTAVLDALATEASANGAELWIPDGAYQGRFTAPAFLRVNGTGTLQNTEPNTAAINVTAPDVDVQGITVDGVSLGGGVRISGDRAHVHDMTVRNVVGSHPYNTGVSIMTANDGSRIHLVTIENTAGAGVHVNLARNVSIIENVGRNITGNMITVWATDVGAYPLRGIRVEGNRGYDLQRMLIEVYADTAGAFAEPVITGNHGYWASPATGSFGISVVNAMRPQVHSNTLIKVGADTIVPEDYGLEFVKSLDANVSGNYLEGFIQGIIANNSPRMVATHNDIWYCISGVGTSGESPDCDISWNRFMESRSDNIIIGNSTPLSGSGLRARHNWIRRSVSFADDGTRTWRAFHHVPGARDSWFEDNLVEILVDPSAILNVRLVSHVGTASSPVHVNRNHFRYRGGTPTGTGIFMGSGASSATGYEYQDNIFENLALAFSAVPTGAVGSGNENRGSTTTNMPASTNLAKKFGAIAAGATGSRPAAATAGQGGMYFDTTLNKPVWSDGTNWRDAAGTVV